MLRRPQRGVLHHAKDEGEVSEVPSVLGTKIVQDLEAGTVTLSQEGYVDSLAEEWAEHLSARKISSVEGAGGEGGGGSRLLFSVKF